MTGYLTRIRLPYHTDGSDVAGLLCFRPARSGGLSTIVSSTTVRNEVRRHRSDLLDLLYETLLPPSRVQFVNNYVILHSRTEYEDLDDPADKRHLLRLRLTLRAGRRLDPDFGRGMGTVDAHGGRGGVRPVAPS